MSFRAILRRAFDSRLTRTALVAAVVGPASAGAATPRWQSAKPLPIPRTEVAAARVGDEILVVGGYLPSGDSTSQVDAYSPARDEWRRLDPLPVAVNHAAAASWRGKLYVVGGYSSRRPPLDDAYVLERGEWRRLPKMPAPRGAAGAAVVGNTLYVVGGVGARGLATSALAFDLVRERWRAIPGPTPREHLAAAAAGGRVYAIAGRRAGIDTNLRVVESYRASARRWTRHRPLPSARGGTGAATVAGTVVSVGGEAPQGTIASVYARNPRTGRWRRLPNLPTPRHGLGVVAFGNRVHVIAGGPRPGLTTSGANEFLTLSR